jgi:serine/threonine-protein kinase
MSPEQATSESDPDARSDIYSLGAVAYFLLTGQPPFEGKNPILVMVAHARDQVIPPSRLTPTIPPDLESIVLRCLAKSPSERFAEVDELDKALACCACTDQWTEERAAEWWRAAEANG